MTQPEESIERWHDDEFVKNLFDKMGPTYSVTNVVTSFGFSEFWRAQCVRNAEIKPGSTVCNMMAGSGECWRYVPGRDTKVISVDFSNYMVERQRKRAAKFNRSISILNENATATSIPSESVDHVYSVFGLKTLSIEARKLFFAEIARILKPDGTFSLLEISVPKSALLRLPYDFYLSRIIPLLGKLLLGDIDCYRMLGEYTKTFGSCDVLLDEIKDVDLSVVLRSHFFGCATSLVGIKGSRN